MTSRLTHRPSADRQWRFYLAVRTVDITTEIRLCDYLINESFTLLLNRTEVNTRRNPLKIKTHKRQAK